MSRRKRNKDHYCNACKDVKPPEDFPQPKILMTKNGPMPYWVCRACQRVKRRTWKLKRNGVTIEEFEAMSERQRGMCAICGRTPKKLVVDHDHDTGKTRALLCHRCNTLLGWAKDNALLLQQAAQYLDDHDSNAKL